MSKTVLQLKGKTNDLLSIDNARNVKMTRLVYDNGADPENEEIVDVSITSVDPSRTHKLFNEEFWGKKIKITVEAD